MKLMKKLGLVAVVASVVTLAIVLGSGGAGSASTPADPDSCYCTMPVLSLTQTDAYWESMAAYSARTLSVDFEVHNNSSNIANAHDMHVVGSTDTNGVSMTDPGRNINVVTAGECELFTTDYSVPMGVSSFQTRIAAETNDQCGNSYSYGEPLP
jgi:hypothetical protein